MIFEDDSLLVVNKPAGLVVTPSETQNQLTLAELVAKDFHIDLERAGIVHRLDKDTSGLLLIAKTQEVLETLQSQFKTRTVKKEYLALCHGEVPQAGEIVGAIGRNPGDREKFVVIESGKEATTRYQLIQRFVMSAERIVEIYPDFSKIQLRKLNANRYPLFSLVRCFPLTGRTHQIRVHLKYIGHPLVGDEKYAGRKTSRLDGRWCKRQFLHAAKITFLHPKTNLEMTFEAPLPEDLQKSIELLEKVN